MVRCEKKGLVSNITSLTTQSIKVIKIFDLSLASTAAYNLSNHPRDRVIQFFSVSYLVRRPAPCYVSNKYSWEGIV